MKGTVVIAGYVLAVTSVRLLNGQFEILAGRKGPVPALTGEPATVFGEDGRGILQGGTFTVREIGAGERLEIAITYQLDRITSEKMTYGESRKRAT